MSTKQYLANIDSLFQMSSSRFGFGFGASRRYLELQHPYLPNVPLSQLPPEKVNLMPAQQNSLNKPDMNRQSGDHKQDKKEKQEKKDKQVNVLETLSKVINQSMKPNAKKRKTEN